VFEKNIEVLELPEGVVIDNAEEEVAKETEDKPARLVEDDEVECAVSVEITLGDVVDETDAELVEVVRVEDEPEEAVELEDVELLTELVLVMADKLDEGESVELLTVDTVEVAELETTTELLVTLVDDEIDRVIENVVLLTELVLDELELKRVELLLEGETDEDEETAEKLEDVVKLEEIVGLEDAVDRVAEVGDATLEDDWEEDVALAETIEAEEGIDAEDEVEMDEEDELDDAAEHIWASISLLFSVMVAVSAKAPPKRAAALPSVTEAWARIAPTKLDPAPKVEDVPTCQKTLQAEAPPVSTTVDPAAVTRLVPTWKIH